MIEQIVRKKTIIICGHYGTGKSNIAVNLAIKIKKSLGIAYTLVDLDTVNPYFRSADNINIMRNHGIDFIVPAFANTNVDIPAVPPEIYSVFTNDKRAIIDVGGDDTGATVLGMFSNIINDNNIDYEMIYVINKYRNMINTPEEAVKLAKLIEDNSKLKITAVINNSHLGEFTEKGHIVASFGYADKISNSIGVPLIGTTVKDRVVDGIAYDLKTEHKIFRIQDYTKKFFN